MGLDLTKLARGDGAGIERASRVILAGGLVAFPTETVYGLGADATNDQSVAAIFAAKSRPQFNPLIVHVANLEDAKKIAEFSTLALILAQRFWPGPLTLVLPRRAGANLSLLATAGLDTVAIRAPSGEIIRNLLALTGLPIAAPSANKSGQVSATSASDVMSELGGGVDMILDGGPTQFGIESTVLGFDGNVALLLRPGALAREKIEVLTGSLATPSARISSPGQLVSHYAPRAKLRLNATEICPDEVLLAFGKSLPSAGDVVANLSENGDINEAAANLFAMLRRLDACGAGTIAVMPIPEYGLGEAINDRLRRAAAPRQSV